MRDYDELVNELHESADWADRLAVLMGRDVGDSKSPLIRKAADAIEELVAQRDKVLNKMCEFCGICSEKSRTPLECEVAGFVAEPPKVVE